MIAQPFLPRAGLAVQRVASSHTLRFIAALSTANAPFWLLGNGLFMSRAFLNVDLAVAIGVMPFSPTAGIVLLLFCWAADLSLSQSLTFHFRSPLEFIESARYAHTVSWSELASWERLQFVLPFVTSIALVWGLTRGQCRLWRPAAIVTIVLVALDATNGSSMLSKRDDLLIRFNIAGSPWSTLGSLASKAMLSGVVTNRPLPVAETAQGLVDIPAWAQAHPNRGILLVLVESMGAPQASDLRQWMSRQLVDERVMAEFDVRESRLPFRGSTTAAELRALCALSGSFSNLDSTVGATCLPARLAALGWHTIGMHGFSPRMFDRERWWPMIGLQSTLFVDARELGQTRCGAAFRGVCDDQVIDAGVQALRAGNRFVYLLTLNTHLPLAAGNVSPDLRALCERGRHDPAACQLVSQLGDVLRHIREGVLRLPAAPLVIVLGDHAPPFASLASRESFEPATVPTFTLRPLD